MSGHVIFKDGKVTGGELKYEDVQKYLPAISQMRAQGQHALADSTLAMLLNTGHPLAIAEKINELLKSGVVGEAIPFADQLRAKADAGDADAMLNWAAFILTHRLPGDPKDALSFMEQLVDKGFAHLTAHAAAYFLMRCLKGDGDQKENNKWLNHWLAICRPKQFKQYQKGILDQKTFLNEIAAEAGYTLT